jgi:hypothetical protein
LHGLWLFDLARKLVSLQTLSIDGATGVRVGNDTLADVIAARYTGFPALQTLSACGTTYASGVANGGNGGAPSLEPLDLMQVIVQSPLLADLTLRTSGLSNRALSTLASGAGDFPKRVRRLDFSHCRGIDAAPVVALIDTADQLEFLDVRECFGISVRDVRVLKKRHPRATILWQ